MLLFCGFSFLSFLRIPAYRAVMPIAAASMVERV